MNRRKNGARDLRHHIGAAAPELSVPAAPAPCTRASRPAVAGALGLFAHYAIYRSLMLADASVVAPLNYVRLVWAIGIGFVVFGDVPDAMTLLGGAITIASGLYVLLWNAR